MEKIAIQTWSVTNENETLFYDDPLTSFLYALKSSEAEAKRQYPARLMKIFDYLEIENIVVDSKNKIII